MPCLNAHISYEDCNAFFNCLHNFQNSVYRPITSVERLKSRLEFGLSLKPYGSARLKQVASRCLHSQVRMPTVSACTVYATPDRSVPTLMVCILSHNGRLVACAASSTASRLSGQAPRQYPASNDAGETNELKLINLVELS